MKAMISTIAILAFTCATVTGMVLAQSPGGERSTDTTGPASAQTPAIIGNVHPVLGKVLFEHVVRVNYSGVEHPANSDGSLGGWVATNENGVQEKITIYENYLVKDAVIPDGTTFREIRPYETLGSIEQRIPASELKHADES